MPLCFEMSRERAVAVVAEQLVRAEIRQQKIDPAVVVDVSRGHAQAVLIGVDAARVGHIGEPQRARAVGVHLAGRCDTDGP